jgi:hypothetical protein
MSGEALAEIARVVAFADARRIYAADLFRMCARQIPPPGHDENYTCIIPVGYRCVFTIEEQPRLGWCRHLSISVQPWEPNVYPNVFATEILLPEFGFQRGLGDIHCFQEVPGDVVPNVNFLQPLNHAQPARPPKEAQTAATL